MKSPGKEINIEGKQGYFFARGKISEDSVVANGKDTAAKEMDIRDNKNATALAVAALLDVQKL